MAIEWDMETDLVIVGAGGCGLMAAFVAAKLGVELILLEKDSRLGCNTDLASGSIAAWGTRFQKAAGIAGTPEQMADDIMRKNHGQADRAIVLELCRRTLDVVDTLVDEVGLDLTLNTDAGRFGHSFLRMHNPKGKSGARITRALHEALARFPNATFADRTPGAGLVTDASGAVIGVRAGERGEQSIGATKVILACDGFGANREMLRRYILDIADVECIGAQGNTGDGIRWGLELGAAVEHMSGHQGHGYVIPGYGTRLVPEVPLLGAVMVNADGARFDREDQGYSELAGVLLKQPRGVAYMFFDQWIYDVVLPNEHFRDTVAAGALKSAATIEELAGAFQLDPQRVRATFDEYYANVKAGRDPLGRETFGKLLEAPFYGAMITGTLAHTQGGLKVDVHGRVLRIDGSVIPNLYAGGGTAAGVSGDGASGYLSGNGLLTALGFGLIAAEHAAAALRAG
ncbi:MAG: FAD-dependent oxidoreductase [Betaproteobacteria bacterium]|nr:FAD-dependent oxidoreductase [Betaproteobacteria bacterium]